MVNAGFGTDVMAIEKVLNVTPEKAKEIKAEISGNAIGEADNSRSDEDVELYGNWQAKAFIWNKKPKLANN